MIFGLLRLNPFASSSDDHGRPEPAFTETRHAFEIFSGDRDELAIQFALPAVVGIGVVHI